MQLTKVESSNVDAVGYDADTQSMEVRFTNGDVYRYINVPQKTFEGLLEAESVGGYMHRQIRGKFDYIKVRREDATS